MCQRRTFLWGRQYYAQQGLLGDLHLYTSYICNFMDKEGHLWFVRVLYFIALEVDMRLHIIAWVLLIITTLLPERFHVPFSQNIYLNRIYSLNGCSEKNNCCVSKPRLNAGEDSNILIKNFISREHFKFYVEISLHIIYIVYIWIWQSSVIF